MSTEERANNRTRPSSLSNVTQQLYEIGKLPPQAVELEEAVLGACMLEKEAFGIVADILDPKSFYTEKHQLLFGAFVSLARRNEPIDMLTVVQELKRTEQLDRVGGAYWVSQLTGRVASSANIEFHARVVVQKFLAREAITIGSDLIKQGYDEGSDVFEITDRAINNLLHLIDTSSRSARDARSIGEYAKDSLDRYMERSKNPELVTGVPTGLRELDRVTNGWQPSDLIIIAARPAMGKTALVLGFAEFAALHHGPVGFLSLEMPGLQLADRLIIKKSGVDADLYRRGKLGNGEMQLVNAALNYLQDIRLYVDETASLSIREIRAKARKMKKKNGIQLLVVDYLQLAQGEEGENKFQRNREQEISTISRGLKQIAKDLNIPVIAISQLSRAVETRGGGSAKRPMLSDLRESGAIEQDADMVLFLHRPEYYGIRETETGKSTNKLAELIIAKHRNGAVGGVDVQFIESQTKFQDIPDSSISAVVPEPWVTNDTKEDPF